MEFGLFMELSVPRPWTPESESQVYENALEQVRLADEFGFDYVWAVEHHFLEEYSHCSAPDLFLTACATQTSASGSGTASCACVPQYQSPIRVAERAAVLDIISGGRARARDRSVRHLARAERVRRQPRRDQEDVGRVRPRHPQNVDAGALLAGRAARSPCPSGPSCPSRSRSLTRRCGWPSPRRAPRSTRPTGASAASGLSPGEFSDSEKKVANYRKRIRGLRSGGRLRQRQGAHGQLPLVLRGRRPRPAQRAEDRLACSATWRRSCSRPRKCCRPTRTRPRACSRRCAGSRAAPATPPSRSRA